MISKGSRWRRRSLGMGMVFLSGILLYLILMRPEIVGSSTRWKALQFGPAVMVLGISGVIHPSVLPDPKPVGGPIGAVGEAGSLAMIVGGVLFFIGLGLGTILLVIAG